MQYSSIPEVKLFSFSTGTGRKYLTYECAKFYNELPNTIRNIPSLEGYKSFTNTFSIEVPNSHLSRCHLTSSNLENFCIFNFIYNFQFLVTFVMYVPVLHLVKKCLNMLLYIVSKKYCMSF